MKLTQHFNLAEFTQSQTATRKGIDNTPNSVIINNLTIVAANMEEVRKLLNNLPISISSGYRSPALNKAVGGSNTSAHVEGWACDFICPAFGTPVQVVDKLKASDLVFDQIIEEGTWVHISFAPTRRKQVLKATFKNGKASYTIY